MKNTTTLQALISRLHRDDAGATMVEYGIMVALIAIVAIAAIQAVGSSTLTSYDNSANVVSTTTSG